jgi:hypothetical protein
VGAPRRAHSSRIHRRQDGLGERLRASVLGGRVGTLWQKAIFSRREQVFSRTERWLAPWARVRKTEAIALELARAEFGREQITRDGRERCCAQLPYEIADSSRVRPALLARVEVLAEGRALGIGLLVIDDKG